MLKTGSGKGRGRCYSRRFLRLVQKSRGVLTNVNPQSAECPSPRCVRALGALGAERVIGLEAIYLVLAGPS